MDPSSQQIEKLSLQIKTECRLAWFDLKKHGEGRLILYSIIVPRDRRNQGLGSKAMQKLVDFADQNDMMITLDAGEKDEHHGTSSQNRLFRFYKRFGFVRNRGRNKEYTIGDNMLRWTRKD